MPVGLQAGSCCTAARLAGTPTGRFIPRQLQLAMTTPVLGGREGDAISRSRLEGSWAGGTSVAPSGASSCTVQTPRCRCESPTTLHAAHAHHTQDTKHTPPHVKHATPTSDQMDSCTKHTNCTHGKQHRCTLHTWDPNHTGDTQCATCTRHR